MRAPLSTPNSFVFLEFGALPVKFIIHCRQLTFLHHIVGLDDQDPVKRMFKAQQLLPYEKNWSNEVLPLLHEYDLDDDDIINMSKLTWKQNVKANVTRKVLSQLTTDIQDETKTKHLSYTSFNCQPYMLQFNHKQASIIFKLRSYSIDCKSNRKSSNVDLNCRLCKSADETQSHVVNCPAVSKDGVILDLSKVFDCEIVDGDQDVINICNRVDDFNKMINDTDSNDETVKT